MAHQQQKIIGSRCIAKLSSEKRGAPEGIRTPDPQIRSLVLYPAELPAPWRTRVACPKRIRTPYPKFVGGWTLSAAAANLKLLANPMVQTVYIQPTKDEGFLSGSDASTL